LGEDFEKRLANSKRALEKQAKEEIDNRLSKLITEKNEAIQRLRQFEGREATLRKAMDDAERKLKGFQQEANKQKDTELLKQRQILQKEQNQVLMRREADFNREREGFQKKLKHLEQQLQRKTANEIGEGAEIDLFESLREAFPSDQIKRIPKGTPGADIVHEVMDRGQNCGQIIYDSKNRQGWRNTFITKLRADQIEAKAEHAILSTTEFPSGQKEFFVQDSVIVINPARVVQIVRVLRSTMMRLRQHGASLKEREGKIGQMYDFISSDDFRNRLEMEKELTRALLEIDVKEKREHDIVWKRRGTLTTRLSNLVLEIDTDLCAILEGSELRLAVRRSAGD